MPDDHNSIFEPVLCYLDDAEDQILHSLLDSRSAINGRGFRFTVCHVLDAVGVS